MVSALVLALAIGSDPAPLAPGVQPVIWTWPQRIEQQDFFHGAGGPESLPRPPFRFVRELLSGTNPKVLVTDAAGRTWSVKWGKEAHAEVFVSRLAWGVGYFVEPTHFVARGRIEDVGKLRRAASRIARSGEFRDARFQQWPAGVELLEDDPGWDWDENPFLGKPWFEGLRVLTMLVSNWDSKESNNGIFAYRLDGVPVWHYAVTDWGGSMGKWGGLFEHSKWDAEGYAEQTQGFVRGVNDGEVQFAYRGKDTEAMSRGIAVSDVDWMLHMLGRIRDDQIRDALRASGADDEETALFAAAVRERIRQLDAAVAGSGYPRAAFAVRTEPAAP